MILIQFGNNEDCEFITAIGYLTVQVNFEEIMDINWNTVIKVTGPVGLVALLIWFVLTRIYSDQIISLFGEEKIFTMTIVILSSLFICLLVAIITFKRKKDEIPQSTENNKVVYKNSTHNGDVVFGSKNDNRSKK